MKKLKYIVSVHKGKVPKKMSLTNTGNLPIYLAMDYLRNEPKYISYVPEYDKCVLVDENEILLLWDGSNAGEFIWSKKGVLSSTMAVIKPKTDIHKSFLFYQFKELERYLKDITVGMGIPHVNPQELLNFSFFIPSFQEQTAIANYLYRKTAEIDELIYQKEQLLKLYEEEKTAIINQAVTRGIKNEKLKMKNSGIEWLGEIPEHWEVKKLKYECKIQGRIGFKGYRSSDLVSNGDGAITLGASHISKKNKIDLSNPIYLKWEKYYESPEIMVKKDDIVFTQRGAYLGKVGLIDKDYGEVTINPSLILLKNIKVNSEFLSFFLTSNFIKENVSVISSDTAIPMISQHQTANFYCLFPPLEEQIAIVKFIEAEVNRINTKAKKTEKLIALLGEYKQSLISEVVTGKVKVV